MSFEFRPGKRENVPLLIGVAGGTGSGKTMSAMRLAKGLAGGKKFAVIDTEAGRALHYADMFEFGYEPLAPPFRPERYGAAIKAADAAGFPVILVDSVSHEHAGDGGLLDWHQEELERMGGGENANLRAWIKPKMAHKDWVQELLQLRSHLILCFRAEQKVEMRKDDKGKWQVVPKASLVGLDGWVPIAEKSLPYELTISFLLTADKPGIPQPIKLQEQHKPFVPLDREISEETGRLLGEWARGSGSPAAEPEPPLSEGMADRGSAESPAENLAAQSGDSPSESGEQAELLPESLSPEEFRRLVASEFIPPQRIAAIGRQLYPGRHSNDLNEKELAELWRALKGDLASVQF